MDKKVGEFGKKVHLPITIVTIAFHILFAHHSDSLLSDSTFSDMLPSIFMYILNQLLSNITFLQKKKKIYHKVIKRGRKLDDFVQNVVLKDTIVANYLLLSSYSIVNIIIIIVINGGTTIINIIRWILN